MDIWELEEKAKELIKEKKEAYRKIIEIEEERRVQQEELEKEEAKRDAIILRMKEAEQKERELQKKLDEIDELIEDGYKRYKA